ncbi:MAG: methyltransferase domain-containing protein [Sedimentisphaerales bacterium]|nr:methyltransferase domain-containing protein [Sedimentisphaerales bacterium]
MGDINQLTFIRKYSGIFNGPYLEVGSKDYGSTQNLRSLFSGGGEYIGIDMEDGPGVDIVLDMTADFNKIDVKLGKKRFGSIFCLSVLEHCDNPFKMAANLTSLLKPGGKICISAPFAWQIHGYPNDYWRFTPEGVKKLFPLIKFDMEQSLASASKKNDFYNIDDDLGKISFSFSTYQKDGHVLRGISAKFLKTLSRIGVWRWLTGYRHLFRPTNVFMIGTLKGT